MKLFLLFLLFFNQNLLSVNENNLLKKTLVASNLDKIISKYKSYSQEELYKFSLKKPDIILKDFAKLLKYCSKLKKYKLNSTNYNINLIIENLNLQNLNSEFIDRVSSILNSERYILISLIITITLHVALAFYLDVNKDMQLLGEMIAFISFLLPLIEILTFPLLYSFFVIAILKIKELKEISSQNNIKLIDIYKELKLKNINIKLKNLSSISFNKLLLLSEVNYNSVKASILNFQEINNIENFFEKIDFVKEEFKNIFLSFLIFDNSLYLYLFNRKKLYNKDSTAFNKILNYHKDLESNNFFEIFKDLKISFDKLDLLQLIFIWSNIWSLTVSDAFGNNLIKRSRDFKNLELLNYFEKNYNYINNFSSLSKFSDFLPDCSICLEKKADFRISCGHKFHKSCIENWIEKNSSCPICRSIIRF